MPHDPYRPNIVNIFDNIACVFVDAGDHFILQEGIDGYNNFDVSDLHKNVAYLARNIFDDGSVEFESGIGNFQTQGSNNIITRDFVVSSSNNNNLVVFSTNGTKVLYIVPNENNYKLAFNNFVSHSGNFTIPDYRASHIVDLSISDVSGSLPPSTFFNAGLLLDFRTINANNTLHILPSGSQTIDGSISLNISNIDHKQLISTGSGWMSLEQDIVLQTGVPQGPAYSLQYNDGNNGFEGSNITTNNSGDLLIGSSNVIRSSGNNEFNINHYVDTDFIVYGDSGKNLFFDGDGKLGINMPSGYVPQVPLHILQNACIESIRVENTHSTNPSIMTLYHKPSIEPNIDSTPSKINLSGKNSVSNQVNYATLYSKILNPVSQSTVGAFLVDTDYGGAPTNLLNISKYNIILGDNNQYETHNSVIGNDNVVVGSGNFVLGKNINHSGTDSVILGTNNNHILLNDSNTVFSLNGNNLITVDNNSGVVFNSYVNFSGINPTGVSVYHSSVILPSGTPDGQILLADSGNLSISNYNINTFVAGNTSGLLIKTENVQPSGSEEIYYNSSGLNINSDIIFTSLSGSHLSYIDSTHKLSTYTDIDISGSSIDINKPIRINSTNNFTIDSQTPDLYTDGYIVSSGLVVDPNTTASSGTVLTNLGDGVCGWQVIDDVVGISVNKYNKRLASVNSLQITIPESIDPQEILVGDNIALETDDGTQYNTVSSINIGENSTIIVVATSFGSQINSGYVYSTTRGGYVDINNNDDENFGSTKNILSIRPNFPTIFNTKKYNIDFGIYGSGTNYAMYIHSNYADNTNDESQIVINGMTPYNISGTNYATMTINGFLRTDSLSVANDVYIDCGTIVFTGV